MRKKIIEALIKSTISTTVAVSGMSALITAGVVLLVVGKIRDIYIG